MLREMVDISGYAAARDAFLRDVLARSGQRFGGDPWILDAP